MGPVGHTLLSVEEIRGRVSARSHGEVSHMWQGLRCLCSRVMSSSWDRSACDEDRQVFLACFQGDADEFQDACHNIYTDVVGFVGTLGIYDQRRLWK